MSPNDYRSPQHPREFGQITVPDSGWLAHEPDEDILFADLPIIDAHHHIGHSLGIDYPLESYLHDTAGGHAIIASVAVEWHSAYRSYGPVSLRPVGETEHVVESTAHQQTSTVQKIAGGIVGGVDLALRDQVGDVTRAHLDAGAGRFRGVRYGASWDPHPTIGLAPPSARPHMLADPLVREGAHTVASLDLPLDLWILGPQLLDVAELAAAVPELTLVVNHCGAPLGYGPYAAAATEHFANWTSALRMVAQHPNVVCKLGGLMATTGAYDYINAPVPPTSAELATAWRPWIQTCIETFSPQRCMFESNFPIEKMGTGYTTLWNAFKLLAADATPAERATLFAGTAHRVYKPLEARDQEQTC